MSRKITQLEFGKRLKQVRKSLGYSQKDFSSKLGIAISTYQHYERGDREAPISLLPKITVFGVSLDWLLAGQGSVKAESDSDITNTNHPTSHDMVELQHMNLVKGFIDKQRAFNIDKELVELEKLAPEVFERIESYIKGSVDTLKAVIKKDKKSCLDRRRGERREIEDPDRIPGGVERRSGPDRRKAS